MPRGHASGREKLVRTQGKVLTDVAASPDGTWYAFPSYKDLSVSVARRSGKGAARTVLEKISDHLSRDRDVTVAWTPDGKALAVANSTGEGTPGSPITGAMADGVEATGRARVR